MKQKESIFSWRLIREGFRQCQMIGILFMIATLLGAIFVPVSTYISSVESMQWSTGWSRTVLNGLELNPVLLLVLCMAPLMTLVLFHFLDSRAASDIYHALPHKRSTLFCSYALAIVMWVVVVLAVNTAVSLLITLCIRDYVIVLYPTVGAFALTVGLIALLAMAGVLVAMSVTGTVFTNVLVSVLLLFLPRTLIELFYNGTVSNMAFYVAQPETSGFFRSENNLLFGLLTAFFGGSGFGDSLTDPTWQSLVYTSLLILVYLVLGGVLFCRRRSEAAGQSAPNRWLQHTYRIALTMTFCSFVTISLYNEQALGSDWIMYVFLYCIGVLIYCIYELITKRSWRNLGKAMPGLLVVAVLNVAAYGGMHLAQNHIIAQRPAAQEIESISLSYDASYYTPDSYLQFGDYVAMQASGVEITDADMIALVSYYLDENIKTWENGGVNGYYSKYYNGNGMGYGYTEYIVQIRTAQKTLCRRIFLPSSEQKTWANALQQTEDYVALWKTLPEPVEGTMTSSFGGQFSLEDTALAQVWDSYQKELAACDFEPLYQAITNWDDIYAVIQYQCVYEGNSYILSCPIVAELMPNTTQLYAESIQAQYSEETETLPDFVAQYAEENLGLWIQIMDGQNDTLVAEYYQDPYGSLRQGTELIAQLYEYRQPGAISPDDTYVTIQANGYEPADADGYRSENTEAQCALFALDADAIEALRTETFLGLNWYYTE